MNQEKKKKSRAFLNYLIEWHDRRPTLELATLAPDRVAVICVDVINGFCTMGPLASPRVQAIVAPIVALFQRAHALGVRHFLLPQDTHDRQAVEFQSYAPHCVRGTPEAQTVPELAALPFAGEFVVIEKNTTNMAAGTKLNDWLAQHPEVTQFILVGDCTDICIYQGALDLRVRANAAGQRDVRIIVPADCVDTYDLPVETARQLGSLPHDGDLLHLIFLYHMALNGVEVVSHVE